ncbi:MAG: hypothetical protein CITR_02947 [Citrobacter freundii]
MILSTYENMPNAFKTILKAKHFLLAFINGLLGCTSGMLGEHMRAL